MTTPEMPLGDHMASVLPLFPEAQAAADTHHQEVMSVEAGIISLVGACSLAEGAVKIFESTLPDSLRVPLTALVGSMAITAAGIATMFLAGAKER